MRQEHPALPPAVPPEALGVTVAELAGSPLARPRPAAAPPTGGVRVRVRGSKRPQPRPVERQVVSLRRSRVAGRRRRPLAGRWIRRLLMVLAVVSSPVAVVLWFLTSPRFALQELGVTTGERVPEAWVETTVEPFLGDNIFRLRLTAVAAALEAHPWLQAADLRKQLPARLDLRVVERQAAALLSTADGLVYLDEEGEAIEPLAAGSRQTGSAAEDLGLVVVSRGASAAGPEIHPSAAIDFLAELRAARPPWLGGLSKVEILGSEDFRVVTDDLPFPLILRAGTAAEKIRRLEELLPRITARYGAVAAVDLRFDRRLIVQPGQPVTADRSRADASRTDTSRTDS